MNTNNSEIRINGQLLNMEKLLANVESMDGGQLKELYEVVSKDAEIVKHRLNMVKILSGKEISKNAYEALQGDMPEEMQTTIEKEKYGDFKNKIVPAYDSEGNKIDRIIYYHEGAKFSRQITKEMVDESTYDKVDLKLSKYGSREIHGRMKLSALNNIKLAIRKRKTDEHVAELEAKKTKNISIAELGRKLLAGNEVQKVEIKVKA